MDRDIQKKRRKLYSIRRHYTIVKSVPQERTVTTKPTEYLLKLPAASAVTAVDAYVRWLENQMGNGGCSLSDKKKLEFELAIAQEFLANLKKMDEVPQ